MRQLKIEKETGEMEFGMKEFFNKKRVIPERTKLCADFHGC